MAFDSIRRRLKAAIGLNRYPDYRHGSTKRVKRHNKAVMKRHARAYRRTHKYFV